MRVIGLDLSLTSTGIATRQGAYSLKTPSDKIKGMERLQFIRTAVWEAINQESFDPPPDDSPFAVQIPVMAVVEGYSYGSKGNAIFNIGELGGIVRLLLWENGIPYAVVPPQTLKIFATGNGGSKKDKMIIETVKRLPDWEVDNNDEVDALWLYAMGHHALGSPIVDLPASHLRALDKVEWPDTVKGDLHTSA
jgi:hypothetical protein